MRYVSASACLAAAFVLSACSSDDAPDTAGDKPDASPALVAACKDLRAGDWSALSDASHAPDIPEVSPATDDLPKIPASGTMEDWFNNTGLFGNAYANDVYQQARPIGWTDDDMKQEAARTFGTAWATCARDVEGFPSEPDLDLEQEVTEGALNLAP